VRSSRQLRNRTDGKVAQQARPSPARPRGTRWKTSSCPRPI